MDNHTAPELLEAVGYDWRNQPDMAKWRVGDGSLKTLRELHEGHYTYCLHHATYTGPALGTPELDGILLVAGQRWLQNVTHSGKRDIAKNLHYDSFEEDSGGWISGRLGLLFQSESPGHALARAIREVQS